MDSAVERVFVLICILKLFSFQLNVRSSYGSQTHVRHTLPLNTSGEITVSSLFYLPASVSLDVGHAVGP